MVSIVNPNPARIAAYAKSRLARTKTDEADAAPIAHCCHTQQPQPCQPWTPPPAEGRELPALEALVRRVEMLQEMAQQEGNRRAIGSGAASAHRPSSPLSKRRSRSCARSSPRPNAWSSSRWSGLPS